MALNFTPNVMLHDPYHTQAMLAYLWSDSELTTHATHSAKLLHDKDWLQQGTHTVAGAEVSKINRGEVTRRQGHCSGLTADCYLLLALCGP